MADSGFGPPMDRARIGWWAVVLALGAFAAYVAYSFVGMIVLGVFGYYATRPVCRRLARYIDSDGIAAGVTVLLFVGPIVLLVVYTGFTLFQEVQAALGANGSGGLVAGLDLSMLPEEQRSTARTLLQNPQQAVSQPQQVATTAATVGAQAFSAIAGGLVLVGLAFTFSHFLLTKDDALAKGLTELFGGHDTTAYAYAAALDEDLESVFFGNLVFVGIMAVIALVVYGATALLAPAGIRVPLVFVLAVLTGITSLIPVVVSKVIYLPLVAYMALQAIQSSGGGALAFVGGALVVYFLLLDILPQTFIQPYVTGRQLDVVVLMFAYLLGPILFGWYGFFLLPIVFIAILELVRIVLPELVAGDPLTQSVTLGESIGTDPTDEREDVETDATDAVEGEERTDATDAVENEDETDGTDSVGSEDGTDDTTTAREASARESTTDGEGSPTDGD